MTSNKASKKFKTLLKKLKEVKFNYFNVIVLLCFLLFIAYVFYIGWVVYTIGNSLQDIYNNTQYIEYPQVHEETAVDNQDYKEPIEEAKYEEATVLEPEPEVIETIHEEEQEQAPIPNYCDGTCYQYNYDKQCYDESDSNIFIESNKIIEEGYDPVWTVRVEKQDGCGYYFHPNQGAGNQYPDKEIL